MNGYMRLEKDTPTQKEGAFGIAMVASYPVKTSPNPKHLPEVGSCSRNAREGCPCHPRAYAQLCCCLP